MCSLLALVTLLYINYASSSFLGLGSLFGHGINSRSGVDKSAEFSVDSGDVERQSEDDGSDTVCLFTSGRRRLRVRGIVDDESDCVADRMDETSLRMDDIADFAPLQVMCEVNGYTVPAIIDTGAQISIMSYSCAQRCRINNNIDTRYAGRAIGVGSSDILGRINGLNMKIGPISFDGKVSILRDSRVDFLIGLDFLKRFNCEVSFKDRALRLQVRHKFYKIPLLSEFYNENQHLEIPASKMDQDDVYEDEYDFSLEQAEADRGYSDHGESDSSDTFSDDIGASSSVSSSINSGSGIGRRSSSLSSSGTRRQSGSRSGSRDAERVTSVDEIIASVKQEAKEREAQRKQGRQESPQKHEQQLRVRDEQLDVELESSLTSTPAPTEPEFDLSGV